MARYKRFTLFGVTYPMWFIRIFLQGFDIDYVIKKEVCKILDTDFFDIILLFANF